MTGLLHRPCSMDQASYDLSRSPLRHRRQQTQD